MDVSQGLYKVCGFMTWNLPEIVYFFNLNRKYGRIFLDDILTAIDASIADITEPLEFFYT